MVSDWFAPRKGGIESQLLGLARALRARGIEPTIITSFPGPPECEGIRVVRLQVPLLPGAQIAYTPTLVSALRHALEDGGYNIAHIHPSVVAPVCLAGTIAARQLNVPALLTFHSTMRTLPALLRLADRATGWAQQDVTLSGVSHHIAAQVQRINGAMPVHVLPNGHDEGFWLPEKARSAPSDTRPFRIVTAMRLEGTKRPLALVRILRSAAKQLAGTGRSIELVVAGEGSYGRLLAWVARRAGVQDRLHLAGWLDREALRALYRDSDVFLLPSTKESFGIAALEARTAGLPVLGRAGTGLADYIQCDEDGILAGSDRELARMIVRLAQNPALLAAMSGPRPALARYAWDEMARAHEHLYRDILSRSRRAPADGSLARGETQLRAP
jgi:glycosyltransferase involved in cell wall biosynthesis